MSGALVKSRIEIAPGANPAGDPSLWVWENAGKRRARSDIVMTAGRDDEATEVEAGSFSTTMDDRDGNLSPRNILGKWYGQLSRGTPLRVVMDRVSDPFTRTVSPGWGSTPEGFAWSVSNGTAAVNGSAGTIALATNNAARMVVTNAGSADAEVVWSITLDVLPTTSNFVSAGLLRHTDASNYIRAHVELTPAGATGVKVQRVYKGATADLLAFTTTAVTYSAGTKVWGKARADGPYIMVKCWVGAVTDEPDTWQGATVDDRVEGTGTGLFAWRINNNAGTYTAKFDDFALTNLLWSGAVPEWPPRWPDKSGADSTTPISAAGIIRRLSQGSSPVNSPLRNQLGGLAAQGVTTFSYYPLEEKSDATQATDALGGAAARVYKVTFGSDDTLPGSAATASLDGASGSILQFRIPSRSTPNGWAVLWFFKMSTLPSLPTEMVEIKCSGTMTRFSLYADGSNFTWTGYDRDGNTIANGVSPFAVNPREWTAMQVETNVSGGTTEVDLLWHQVGDDTFYASTDTYSGSSIKPDYFSVIAAGDSMSIAHIWAGDNDLPFVDDTFRRVADGYRGELAADRFARLCGENNVPAYVLDGDTEPMGRQRSLKLVDLLRECEAADQGVMCERGNALMFIPRMRRYNVPVSLALDWSLGHLDEPPEPVDDDQRLRNLVQVNRVEGSSTTLADQASIDRSGTYDESYDLNIDNDARLIDFAGWLLNLGTADYLRWPRIKINLLAHPELIPMWLACRVGSRITIANPPIAQLAGEVIDLVIEGWTQTLNNYEWTVELACSPAQPWIIGAYDDGSLTWRYDVDSVAAHDLGETDQWLGVTVADEYGYWGAANVPYNVRIAGQINTVVGCSDIDSVDLADGTFETYDPVTGFGWVATGATSSIPVRVGSAHRGSYAIQATTSGSPSQTIIRQTGPLSPAAAPGQTFTVSGWVKCSTARNVTMTLDWINAGGAWFGSVSNTVAVAANTWTQITVSGTAPALTAKIQYGPTIASSPTNGTVIAVDDLTARRTDVRSRRQLLALTRAVDGFPKAISAGASVRLAKPAKYGL